MEVAGRFWKPGQTKPNTEAAVVGSGGQDDHEAKDNTFYAAAKDRNHSGSRGASMEGEHGHDYDRKTRGRKSKGKDKLRDRKLGGASSAPLGLMGKPAGLAGPSQGLLAMKFMQRKARADEAQQEQLEKRDKLERDFSFSYAKRLKIDSKDSTSIVCQPDEQDPALVILGRRSFGGFNVVAEAAYDACIREIAAGTRLDLPLGREEDDDGGDAISNYEMADRLGKNLRRGWR